MELYLRAMGKKKYAVDQHHGQITQIPAVGGNPTCKLICMYLHNLANFVSLGGPKALHHGGFSQPLFRGLGRETVKARD